MIATPDSTLADPKNYLISDLQRQLAERTAERDEALEQQTATAEVLQVINASPGDLAPVFDAILDKGMQLCGAAFGALMSYDSEQVRAVSIRGFPPALADLYADPIVPRRDGDSPYARFLRGERLLHIADMAADEVRGSLASRPRALVEIGGARTGLELPLRKDGVLLGSMWFYRQEVQPFSDKQIALLENFAAQAVIAMENARLITETREALEQQTATAEVLQVINASPGDLAPVWEVMLEKATRLCEAASGILWTYDGGRFRAAAVHGATEEYVEWLHSLPDPVPSPSLARIVSGEKIVRDDDLTTAPGTLVYAHTLTGMRTGFLVALRKGDALLGAIRIFRQDPRPFSDKHIVLVENFAAQAVIAMENARLLGELRDRTTDLEESLEYQTATSNVFQVISRSTFDLQPVLDTLLATAARLCSADFGALMTRESDVYRTAAIIAISPEHEAFVRGRTFVPSPAGSSVERTAFARRIVHIPNVAVEPEYPSASTSFIRTGTALGVPLLREGEPLGVITLHRHRVEPFTERQIELVRTFADQAVIAIENTRLLTELRESLEQQQAIAEILQVINRSPGELQPVFDVLLEKAMRLCGAAFGTLAILDSEQARTVAAQGLPPALGEWRQTNPIINSRNTLLKRVVAGDPYVHTLDLKDSDLYERGEPLRRTIVDLGGARTSLYVPLKRDREVLGTIHIYRQEVHPFSDKQIALLQNFAAQAVIAMENARLLNEVRQRQEELRITFENMGDGVAMFDETPRLIAWNRKLQDMLDLPDAVLEERPSYLGYLRILAERGEFGSDDIEAELSRRLEHIDQELRLERTRSDGRVLEVRRNAVPDGGFVLIYSDITERKRSETEIRAARDAAEATLRDLRAAQSSLIQAQKMAALGQLTAGIAHEIKNPLNFVNNFAGLSVELLEELKETAGPVHAQADPDTRAEIDETIELLTGNLDKIAEHGRRADNIVKSMLEHSRGVTSERREVDLNNLVEEALNLAYHGARAQDQSFNITLGRDYDRDLAQIELVPQEMSRVFLNLFSNGFYAATKRQREGNDPHFKPTLKVMTRAAGDAIEITVRDNGTGIPPEIRDRLFQPFFTTKPTGEGTGLGLSLSYDIVTQQHGGSITVESEPGAYTEFTIRLPRRASAGAAA